MAEYLKEDILGYLAQDSDVAIPTPEIAIAAEDRVEPIKGVRKIMAERMSVAVATIPHFTYVDEMDVTDLMQFRQSLKTPMPAMILKLPLCRYLLRRCLWPLNSFQLLIVAPMTISVS